MDWTHPLLITSSQKDNTSRHHFGGLDRQERDRGRHLRSAVHVKSTSAGDSQTTMRSSSRRRFGLEIHNRQVSILPHIQSHDNGFVVPHSMPSMGLPCCSKSSDHLDDHLKHWRMAAANPQPVPCFRVKRASQWEGQEGTVHPTERKIEGI